MEREVKTPFRFLFQENLESLKTAAILLGKVQPKTEEAKQI